MKFFFLKEHGLYKIFKTLEKVPAKKTIHINIDPEHAFFENERRAAQLKELLDKKEIVAFFIAKTQRTKNFFDRTNLPYIFQEKHPIRKALHIAKLFLFDIKRFHLHAIEKKNYLFFVVFGAEFLFVALIILGLYTLIVPSVNVQITPTYQVEDVTYNFRYYPASDTEYPNFSRYLNIPFYSWYLDHNYELTISANNIRHIQNPSKWTITIYNTTEDELNLVANTRFITEDWLFFKATNGFTIPSGNKETPSQVDINVEAMEFDDKNIIIGTRGNIGSWTQLRIRNITKSYFTKEIYATTKTDFQWWSSTSTWFLTQEDTSILSGKLIEYIQKNTANIITKNFRDPEAFFINFSGLIHYEINNITIQDYTKQQQPILKGTVSARIYFPFVKRSDFNEVIMLYTEQRPSEKTNVISIDRNSLVFYDDIKTVDNLFVIPTKISVIQWYDFEMDINKVSESIKNRITGLRTEQAREIILSYPEISTARIVIRPPRYTTIPTLKSRINLRIEDPK